MIEGVERKRLEICEGEEGEVGDVRGVSIGGERAGGWIAAVREGAGAWVGA